MLTRRFIISALVLVLSGSAMAATTKTGTYKSTASVANSCVIVNQNTMSFGSYDPTNASPITTSGKSTIRCTKGTVYSLSPTSLNGKNMKGTSGSLQYELYTTAALSQVFGAGATIPTQYYTSGNNIAYFSGQITVAQYNANKSAYASNVLMYFNGSSVYTNYLGTAPNVGFGSGQPTGWQTGTSVISSSSVVNSSSTLTTGATQTLFLVPTTSTPITGTAASGLTSVDVVYYGRVAAKQDLVPGSYSDTVTMTVSF